MTDAPTSKQTWADEPLSETDISGRPEFARAVSVRIDDCIVGQGSTVFGIVGPWGSGKTTLLQNIVGQLNGWKVVWFAPWSAADVESLTSEFVSALAEAFPDAPAVKKKLASYSRFGAPALKAIPIVGDAAAAIVAEIIAEVTKRPAWHSEFAKLSADIASQDERVLVIVDDVDRLDGEELRALLRVVRLLGRFTNVHYLLAYDQATIESVLGSVGADGATSEFMEKIVQYPFEIPPTPMAVRRGWSRSIIAVASAIDETNHADHADGREELVKILASGLETPRSAERLRAQLLSMGRLIKDAEIDVLDFTALTWLRVAHHKVWDDIRLNSNEYLTWQDRDSDEKKIELMRRVDSLVARGHVKPVQDAITYLFEPLDLIGEMLGNERRARIRNSRYFDRYFHVGLAEDDVSERKTENALRDLDNGLRETDDLKFLSEVILGASEERSALALDVVGGMRRQASATSLAVLDYAQEMQSGLAVLPGIEEFRVSAAGKWVADELFRAFEAQLQSTEDFVARFGYLALAGSAYAQRRSSRRSDENIRALYTDLVERWIVEVKLETLEQTLAREELVIMTSFASWIDDRREHAGFLTERIDSGAALVAAAIKYVSFNEWVGSGVHYDIVFREPDFRFAVANALTASLVAEIPEISADRNYEVSDRLDRDLADVQRRDFAVRSIHALNLM